MKRLDRWMRLRIAGLLCLSLGLTPQTDAAVGQMLTDYFFQNPADLGLVRKQQLIVGNLLIAPTLDFNGTATGGTGQARSSVVDSLPYLLADIRLSDKWVLGFNVVPSEYGHLNWPIDSVVAHDSTVTKIYYYLLGFQSSFQLSERITLGLGLNIHYHYLAELDALVGNLGNEVNKASAINNGLDAGLRYKITNNHTFIVAFYSPVDRYAHGTSTLANVTSHAFQLNLVEAAVVFAGLQQQFSERWFVEEKLFWSNWTGQNNITLKNTTRGTLTYPTNWTDAWSYMVAAQYRFTDKLAGFATVMYETNPVPDDSNSIAYPVAPTLFFSGGVDLAVYEQWRMQLVYGYGFFIPKAQIGNGNTSGTIADNTHTGALQFTYQL